MPRPKIRAIKCTVVEDAEAKPVMEIALRTISSLEPLIITEHQI